MNAGTRDGNWSVELPVEEVPPELPEPCLGINFARDGMQKRDWLALVAVHSDSWLMAVAFFYAVKLDAAGRCGMCVCHPVQDYRVDSQSMNITMRPGIWSSQAASFQADQL